MIKNLAVKIYIWKDLKYKARKARKEMNSKRDAITTCEWATRKKSCIKITRIHDLNDVSSTNGEIQCYAVRNCRKFSECKACTNSKCPMNKLNNEYIGSMRAYEALRRLKHEAFVNIFKKG